MGSGRTRSVITALIAVVSLGLSATPASAQSGDQNAAPLAGGGCVTSTQNGWNVGVCASDNGATVFGDLYVNSRGSLGSSCYVLYRLLDQNTGTWVASSGNHSCYTGHHPNISAPKVAGHRYLNYGYVYVNGVNVFASTSPFVY